MALADRLSRQVRFGAELAGAAWPQFIRPLALELASHRPIREVLPGVHHWTAIHPRIRLPVDSYFIESAGIVLDPMVPREGLEWFERRGTPSQIVLTNRHHLRDSEAYAEAFGCPIRCSDAGLHEFEGGPEGRGLRVRGGAGAGDHRTRAGGDLPGRHRDPHPDRRRWRARLC